MTDTLLERLDQCSGTRPPDRAVAVTKGVAYSISQDLWIAAISRAFISKEARIDNACEQT